MEPNKTVLTLSDALRRHLDLPDWVDGATVQAALRCAPPPDQVRAAAAARRPIVRAAAPAPRPAPVLDAANLCASSAEELRSLAASPLTTADRAAVAEEVSHRQLMGTAFPAAIKARDGRVRIHFAS